MSDADRIANRVEGPAGPPADAAGPDSGAAAGAAAAGRGANLGWQAKLAVAAVAACALAALFWPRGGGSFEAPGGFLVDYAGRPALLGSRMAPVTLVHFWATWCPPCIVEIPALQRLADDLGRDDGFALLMVAVDDDAEKVRPFVGHIEQTVLYDPNWDVAHRYGTRKLPETYLVAKGKVVKKYVGAQDWDDPQIRGPILAALRDGTALGQQPAG